MSNTTTIDKIFDKMAEEDRETERKNEIISCLVENNERPIFNENDVDATKATVVPRNEIAEEDKQILSQLTQPDEDYIPSQPARIVRPTQPADVNPPKPSSTTPHTATSTSTKSRSLWSSFMAGFQKLADTVVSATTTSGDSFNDARADRPRRGVQRLARRRTDDIVSLGYETFAYLDTDKDGKITKDEAWMYVCKMCRKAREVIASEHWDLDAWLAMRDDFEDILVEYPSYHMSSDGFVSAFREIDMDDQTLRNMLAIMLDTMK